MENLLLKYMAGRLELDDLKPVKQKRPGPVVTISREAGCAGSEIARLLALRLSELAQASACQKPWEWLNKEVISSSAQELNMHPEEIRYVFNAEQKTLVEDVLSSMSNKYYKSDRRIRRVIHDVVRSIAETGHVIIVGRGGVAIAHDIERALHIRLYAPAHWRNKRICEKHQWSEAEAMKHMNMTDQKRLKMREQFQCKGKNCLSYDLEINCARISPSEVVEMIVCSMRLKKLIK